MHETRMSNEILLSQNTKKKKNIGICSGEVPTLITNTPVFPISVGIF